MKIKGISLQKSKPWPFVLGIDVGAGNLKYFFLRRRAGKLWVEGFGKHSFEAEGMEESPHMVGEIVHALFRRDKRFKKAKVVVGVDGNQLVLKKESFPPMPKKELDQAIAFDLQREVSKEGKDIRFVYDFQAVGPDSKKEGNTEYMAMGMPEETVDEKIGIFVSEGAIPVKVSPYIVSMGNLIRFLPPVAPGQCVGILDIGAQRSMLVFFRDGKMDFSREIVVGGDDFTKAVTGTIFHEGKAIQFTTNEANRFKLQYGYPLGFSEGMSFRGAPISEIGTMMRPVVERLSGEVHRSIGFYKDESGGREVVSLYLIGGGAQLKHLAHVMSEKLGIPVSQFVVPEKLKVEGGKLQKNMFHKKFLEQAVSFSLALETSPEGNLLPQPFKKIHRMSMLQNGFRLGALGLAAVIFLLSLDAFSKLHILRKEVKVMKKRATLAQANVRKMTSFVNKKNMLESKIQKLDLQLQSDDNLVQVMRLISNVLPKHLSLLNFQYGPLKTKSKKSAKRTKATATKKTKEEPKTEEGPKWMVSFEGASDVSGPDVRISVAKLIMELEKSGYLSDVHVSKEKAAAEGKDYLFEVTATINR